ncbi:MAG TPA: hypothetical protein VFY69_07615 [Solirubrobacterales bacterium]|nr:hypothetical protein [Solirubrobacterales bacterium]
MKYIKMLGLLALAASALMVLAGTASAKLTEAAGDEVEAGDAIHAVAVNTSLDGAVNIECAESTVSGEFTENGGTTATTNTLTFTECNKDTVTLVKTGSLTIESNGTVKSTGAEVTVQIHRTVFGFPVTTHCVYASSGTAIGTLEESSTVVKEVHNPGMENEEKTFGGTAKINIASSGLGQIPTDGACGENSQWTGSYTVTTPDYLDVD